MYQAPTPILNSNAEVFQALNYMNNINNTYFVLGGTNPWEDESNPPIPSESTIMDTISLYVQPTCYLCYKTNKQADDGSTIQYNSSLYQPVDASNAYDKGANYIYYTCTLDPNQVSLVAPTMDGFREIGLAMGAQVSPSVANNLLATPDQMNSVGRTIALAYSQPFYITNNTKITISMLLHESKREISVN